MDKKELVVESQLQKIMGQHGHTIQHVVDETRLARDTVSKLYYSEGKSVQFETLATLCAYYDCEVGDILHVVPKDEATAHLIPRRRKTTKKRSGGDDE